MSASMEVLLRDGEVLDRATLAQAMQKWKEDESYATLPEYLVEAGLIGDEELTQFLVRTLKLPRVDARLNDVPEKCLTLLPKDLAAEFRAVPIALDNEANLTVLMSDPTWRTALDEIGFFTGCSIFRALATQRQTAWALARYYGIESGLNAPPTKLTPVESKVVRPKAKAVIVPELPQLPVAAGSAPFGGKRESSPVLTDMAVRSGETPTRPVEMTALEENINAMVPQMLRDNPPSLRRSATDPGRSRKHKDSDLHRTPASTARWQNSRNLLEAIQSIEQAHGRDDTVRAMMNYLGRRAQFAQFGVIKGVSLVLFAQGRSLQASPQVDVVESSVIGQSLLTGAAMAGEVSEFSDLRFLAVQAVADAGPTSHSLKSPRVMVCPVIVRERPLGVLVCLDPAADATLDEITLLSVAASARLEAILAESKERAV